MIRNINIGDRVLCTESGIVGKVLSFYVPTSCEEQTKVLTDDGREYHAPTRCWVKHRDGNNVTIRIVDEYCVSGSIGANIGKELIKTLARKNQGLL